jgi:hypothetical protein
MIDTIVIAPALHREASKKGQAAKRSAPEALPE